MLSAFATPTTSPRFPLSMSPTREFGSHTLGSGSMGTESLAMVDSSS